MSRTSLSGSEHAPSPEANRRGRRNTVDNPYMADSALFAPSISQETRTSLLRRWTEEHHAHSRALPRNMEPLGQGMEDVALDDGEEDEELDDEWDMMLDSLLAEECEAWDPRPTAMSWVSNYLWSIDEGEHRPQQRYCPGPFVFDDDDMVSIDEEDEEEDDRPEGRNLAWDYNIPFGPRVQYDYTFDQLYPRTAMALDFTQTLPGMRCLAVAREIAASWGPAVQNNIIRTYNDIGPRAVYTAQRTQEALVASAQVGGHLAAEAWTAGQSAAQMIQDTWRAVQPTVQMLRDGRAMRLLIEGDVLRMVLQDAAVAGLSAIPPYDLILRSSGGRRRL